MKIIVKTYVVRYAPQTTMDTARPSVTQKYLDPLTQEVFRLFFRQSMTDHFNDFE